MSKRVQENAEARIKAARQREKSARIRAQRAQERGRRELARIHAVCADLQADAAAQTKTLLEMDQEVEGNRLDD